MTERIVDIPEYDDSTTTKEIEEVREAFTMYGRQQKVVKHINRNIEKIKYERKNIVVVDYNSAFKELEELGELLAKQELFLTRALKTNNVLQLRKVLLDSGIIDVHTPSILPLV
jgi:ATP-dependent RNA circularization protein (DNA/RNA ligase family)